MLPRCFSLFSRPRTLWHGLQYEARPTLSLRLRGKSSIGFTTSQSGAVSVARRHLTWRLHDSAECCLGPLGVARVRPHLEAWLAVAALTARPLHIAAEVSGWFPLAAVTTAPKPVA